MAPFKLKFRMGGSRSTSSEHESDPASIGGGGGASSSINTTNATNQGSQSVINSTTSLIHFGSTSTIDSDHNTDSLVSLSNNDQRALLQNCGQLSQDSIGKCVESLFLKSIKAHFSYMITHISIINILFLVPNKNHNI